MSILTVKVLGKEIVDYETNMDKGKEYVIVGTSSDHMLIRIGFPYSFEENFNRRWVGFKENRNMVKALSCLLPGDYIEISANDEKDEDLGYVYSCSVDTNGYIEVIGKGVIYDGRGKKPVLDPCE